MTLAVFQTTVQNAVGDAIPSAQVTVRLGSSSGALASLFSNSAGTTPITNPFNATTNGFARFFAAPGVYWISITGGGSTQVLERVMLAGDVATMAVTTSSTDTTLGRLLKVRDFGIGSSTTTAGSGDLDSLPNAAQFFAADSAPSNWRNELGAFPTGVKFARSSSIEAMIGIGYAGSIAYRAKSNPTTWQPWRELYHEANLTHLQNTSGGTINSNATVAGSGLTPAQTGTWRNVAGVNITANGFGLFMRVV